MKATAARQQEVVTPLAAHDVLIVEDDPVIRQALTEVLERQGFSVSSAADGQEALHLLGHAPARVAIIDLMLPVLSGRELVRQMDASPALARVARVFITAASNVHHAPVPGPLFVKPLNVPSLTRAVRALLDATRC